MSLTLPSYAAQPNLTGRVILPSFYPLASSVKHDLVLGTPSLKV